MATSTTAEPNGNPAAPARPRDLARLCRPWHAALARLLAALEEAEGAMDDLLSLDPGAYPAEGVLCDWSEVAGQAEGASWALGQVHGILDALAPPCCLGMARRRLAAISALANP